MKSTQITRQCTTGEIQTRWPETIAVFREHQMRCVGCYMSVFDTLEDAAIVYNIPIEEILAALNERVEAAEFHNTECPYE